MSFSGWILNKSATTQQNLPRLSEKCQPLMATFRVIPFTEQSWNDKRQEEAKKRSSPPPLREHIPRAQRLSPASQTVSQRLWPFVPAASGKEHPAPTGPCWECGVSGPDRAQSTRASTETAPGWWEAIPLREALLQTATQLLSQTWLYQRGKHVWRQRM